MKVLKPKYKRKVGMPQLNRIRYDIEGRSNPTKGKRTCGSCGSSAHNVRTCLKKNGPSTSARGKGIGRARGRGNPLPTNAG
ncbi:hypothetical protein MKX01_031316, partial [Papaver californicum]